MAVQLTRWQFTVNDYYRMGAAGILTEDDRVELIEGEVIAMPPIGARHMRVVNALNRLLVRAVGDEADISPQNPVLLGELSAPQPDLVVIQRYADPRLPTAEDILLLIEVSDTTLAYDRRVKLPLYARWGVREVWIVDVEREIVMQHTQPQDGSYQFTKRFGRGATIVTDLLPTLSLTIEVDTVFA